MNSNLEKMQSALKSLINHHSSSAYTVFSDKSSGRYIQVSGADDSSLHLDLPVQSLSAHEYETAEAVFREYGSGVEVSPLVNKSGGEVDAHFGFHLQFGPEYVTAARVLFYVMLTVFELKQDFELAIDENL